MLHFPEQQLPAAGLLRQIRHRLGVRCFTWVAGGYCNGLARTGEVLDKPLCAACSGRASDVGRSMLSYALMGALGMVLRKRR